MLGEGNRKSTTPCQQPELLTGYMNPRNVAAESVAGGLKGRTTERKIEESKRETA